MRFSRRSSIHRLFGRGVHRGETAQRRLLVGCVVVEVGAGRAGETTHEEGHQLGEGALLLHAIVGPEGAKAQLRMAGHGLALRVTRRRPPEHAAQVLEATRVHRVALEVEEQVVRIGQRQTIEAEPRRVGQDLVDARTGGCALLLQPRLLDKPRQRLGRDAGDAHAVEAGEHGERRDAGLQQSSPSASS